MYIDVGKAHKLGLIGKVKVRLNGICVDKCIAAKSGKNGFVEYLTNKLSAERDGFLSVKKRGNVKVSFNLYG